MNDNDFEVTIPSETTILNDAVLVTDVSENDESIRKLKKLLNTSAYDFEQTRHTYSRYLGGEDGVSSDALTLSKIDEYAKNPQNSWENIQSINKKIKEYVNKDDIIGKVYESVQIYTNTQHSLTYPILVDNKKGNKVLEQTVKPLIEKINTKIDIDSFILKGTATSFLEGNFVSYLRTDKNGGKAVVDFYPISIVEIAEYNLDGEPVVLFNIEKLKSKLKIKARRKKNGKDLFYDKAEEVIKNNYPSEVYQAYKNNEKYAVLDPKRTGLVRINDLGGLYGLTPIFKALKPALLLESIENADETIVRVRSKKIVHQKLRKEIAGSDYNKEALDEMLYAHNNLVSAWKNKTVLITTPWYVEDISYVSDDTPLTDTETLKAYRSRVFNSLGVNFLDTEASLNLSNVSVTDLIKTIDKIAEGLSKVINKYYKLILEENGIDIALAPEIEIMSSELLSLEMRKALSEFMFTKLACSYQTAYSVLGVSSAETESIKRTAENDKGYNEIFKPHENYFNQTGENEAGRPEGEKTNKQQYDGIRNKSKVK